MKQIERGLFIAVVMAIGMATLSGCAGTTSAYKAADGLEETAFVMNQHYLALVREANDLAQSGALTGTQLAGVQDLVRESRPLLSELAIAAQAYESIQNADSDAALTNAIANAAVVLSNLVNAVRQIGGSSSLIERVDRDLLTTNRVQIIPRLFSAGVTV